jgi:hypothetical protein
MFRINRMGLLVCYLLVLSILHAILVILSSHSSGSKSGKARSCGTEAALRAINSRVILIRETSCGL